MASGWHRKTNDAAAQARKRQYNSREHKTRRAATKRDVDAGVAYCWRCGCWIPPGADFHLGHDDYDRSIYRGAECPPCNVKAAARKGAQIANGRRSGTHTGPAVRRTRAW